MEISWFLDAFSHLYKRVWLSVRPSITHELKSCKSAVFDQNYWHYERERILCRVYGFVLSFPLWNRLLKFSLETKSCEKNGSFCSHGNKNRTAENGLILVSTCRMICNSFQILMIQYLIDPKPERWVKERIYRLHDWQRGCKPSTHT